MKACIGNNTVTPVLRQLHSNGAVITEIENMLSNEEAEYIVEHTKNKLNDSKNEDRWLDLEVRPRL